MNKKFLSLSAAVIGAFAVFSLGCQNGATTSPGNTNINTNLSNANLGNSQPANVNTGNTAGAATNSSQVFEANEPNEYSAKMELRAETTGTQNSVKTPPLTADFVRSGENRRVSFNLPNNEQVVYLNVNNKRYLILPTRKQYAEITENSLGFQPPRLMMPGELINYLKSQKGFERVGDEQLNGRAVVKYRAAGAAQTQTQAGQVNAESFTYVDKETGLPLRAEFMSQATGNVQGVQGLLAVIEMRDLELKADPAQFNLPEGYEKITEEQVKTQVNAVSQAALAIAGAFLNNLNSSTNNNAAPNNSSSPSSSNTSTPANSKP